MAGEAVDWRGSLSSLRISASVNRASIWVTTNQLIFLKIIIKALGHNMTRMIYKLTYFPEKRWKAVDGQGKLAISCDLHFPIANPPSKFCLKQIVISNYRGSTKAISWWEQDNIWHQYFSITPLQYSILRIHFVSSYQLVICSIRMEILHFIQHLLL